MALTRIQVRRWAALAAGVMAAIYYLIGLGVLYIGGSSTGEVVNLAGFGAGAGTAFLVFAVLFITTDRRWIWVAALIFQAWVYVAYVAASAGREPPFEIWGITLRVIQVPVALALVYLSFKQPGPSGSRLR